jgi:hypothetical protein
MDLALGLFPACTSTKKAACAVNLFLWKPSVETGKQNITFFMKGGEEMRKTLTMLCIFILALFIPAAVAAADPPFEVPAGATVTTYFVVSGECQESLEAFFEKFVTVEYDGSMVVDLELLADCPDFTKETIYVVRWHDELCLTGDYAIMTGSINVSSIRQSFLPISGKHDIPLSIYYGRFVPSGNWHTGTISRTGWEIVFCRLGDVLRGCGFFSGVIFDRGFSQ